MNDNNDYKNLIGRQVKIVVTNGWYYKGVILSVGKDYLRLRDFNDKTCMINLNAISMLEVHE